jgi:subtilisin family serine protease
MFMTNSRRPRCLLGFRKSVASAVSAMSAVVICSGLVSPVGGEDRVAVPSYDRGVLSEMARDVLRHGATGGNQSVPEHTSPAADAKEELAVVGSAPDPASPVTHIAPAREGISVAIPPASSAPKKKLPASATTDYQSNSWRQRPDTARALSFSSGVLAPSSGLDPALKAHADGLRAQGRQFVYGFLLPRVRLDEALERKLAGLGVQLLGPHDDHHKARLPVGSLEAIAAMADVEWIGVSAREQKLSLELTDLRGSQAQAAIVDPATPIPIIINLFEGDESGHFRQQLEAAGAAVGEYNAALQFYPAVATGPTIDKIAALDFVLFVEPIELTFPAHDQSTPLIDADMIRPGVSFGLTRFGGDSIPVGILDTGFTTSHSDLIGKTACGYNFTTDAGGPYDDQIGHGTHVLATIAGTGTANSRYRGVAPGVGTFGSGSIREAKIFGSGGSGQDTWILDAMDYMASAAQCGLPAPLVVNLSGGSVGTGLTGTDVKSRALDDKVFFQRQVYVVAAGNDGPGAQTIWSPAVAKNALTVGNVSDNGFLTVGDVTTTSSRGPTGDNRMKPNLVAPGATVTSALAGTTNGYITKNGTSMATPHVTGLAATLMEHYPSLKSNPALLRAHMMATAIAHGAPGKSNEYGLGRASGYVAHWDHPNSDGWSTSRFSGGVSSQGLQYGDITVPAGTKRLVVVLTWDEPGASAGASRAVTYDLDLWVDHNADCTEPQGFCGEYSSVSSVDNVEYILVDNPPAGTYRLKVLPYNAPGFALPYGIAATIIRGSPAPPVGVYMTATPNPTVGSEFGVTVNVYAPSYVASAVQVEPSALPLGVTPSYIETMRLDGVTMTFPDALGGLTLGNIVPGLSRSATWYFRADSPGPKTFWMRGSWGSGGTFLVNTTVDVVPPTPDLVTTTVTTNPPVPIRAPGTTFSVTDTVQNAGTARAEATKTRYYLSLDAVKSAEDTLLTGSRSVHGLDPGSSQSGTVTVTIPAATPANAYFLLACADDANAVTENNEDNNCIATATALVTVARPDLVEATATTNPPAPVRAPGTTFSVTDTVHNAGPAPSGSSTTRYYLSLDGVKNAGDTLLTGSRGVAGLAGGASQSGTVTVTIPVATPLNTYFLLACADDLNAVAEGNESNNCIASATATVTVTRPDLVETTVSAPPTTKVRGTSFPVTDTVQNIGAVASVGSATRYYLSLDAVKSAGDALLTGSRAVPGLAAGALNSGTVTVTIPAATPPNTYFLLACADGPNTVVETNETNNCTPSSTTVTVTP